MDRRTVLALFLGLPWAADLQICGPLMREKQLLVFSIKEFAYKLDSIHETIRELAPVGDIP